MKLSLPIWIILMAAIVLLWSHLDKSGDTIWRLELKRDSLELVALRLEAQILLKEELIRLHQDSAQVVRYIRDTVIIRGKERSERVKSLPQDSATALFKAATDTINIPKDLTPITIESFRIGAANSLFVQLETANTVIDLQGREIRHLEAAIIGHEEKDTLQSEMIRNSEEMIRIADERARVWERKAKKEKRKFWAVVGGAVVLLVL